MFARRLVLLLTLTCTHGWGSEKVDVAASSQAQSTRPDQRALVGGSLLFGVSYGLAGTAAAQDYFGQDSHLLWVPLAGPWIVISKQGGEALALDGIAQLGGVALVTGSFLFPERTLGPARAHRPSFQLRVGRTRSEIGLGLRF